MTDSYRSRLTLVPRYGKVHLLPIRLCDFRLRFLEVDVKKLLTMVLVLLTASLGLPVSGYAQTKSSASLGTISGETMDAGGRALANQRVELLRDSQVFNSTTSNSRGEWSFANVAAGEYVVRTVVNGKVAGARVSVTPGQMMVRAMIVAPSAAAASPAFLAAMGPLWGTLLVVGVAAAVVGTTIAVTGS